MKTLVKISVVPVIAGLGLLTLTNANASTSTQSAQGSQINPLVGEKKLKLTQSYRYGRQYRSCRRWKRVCTGNRRCVRWVNRASAQCFLCSRYATIRGRRTALGRLVTCDTRWKARAERQGWVCQMRTNPRGVDSRGRHCVTWTRDCRYVCTYYR